MSSIASLSRSFQRSSGVKKSMSRSWQPLPKGFFSCPRMSFEDEEYLRKLGRSSMKELIRLNMFLDPTIRWKATGEFDRIAMFQGDDLTESGLTYMCAKTELRGTISEVGELFFPDDEPLVKLRRLFPDLLDAQTMYTLNLPSARAPRHFIGIQWMLLESASTWMKHRDFCVLECQDEFTDGSGRLGWARSLTSIKTNFCPELDPSAGVVRGCMFRTGCIFVETELPGRLEATYFVQMDFRGQAPKPMQISGMKKHIKAMAMVESVILQIRLLATPFLSEDELVPKSARKACQVCKISFGSLKRRRRCRKCGEVVCLSCSSHVQFDPSFNGPLQLRICSSCVLHTMLPNEFPNPIRSKSQRMQYDYDSDDIDFGVRTPRSGGRTPRSRSQRSHSPSSQDNKHGGFGGWLTPKSKRKDGFSATTPKGKGKSKGASKDDPSYGYSVYAPREHLEQPKTPRRHMSRNANSNRSYRETEDSAETSKHSHHSSDYQHSAESTPPPIQISLASAGKSSRDSPQPDLNHEHSATQFKKTYRESPQYSNQPQEDDLTKYSTHGMMARQRVQLQQMQAQLFASQQQVVQPTQDNDGTISDVFSICDTETLQEVFVNPNNNQVTDVAEINWIDSCRISPTLISESIQDSPRFIELPPNYEPQSITEEEEAKAPPVQVDVDLASVMKSMQSCLKADGTFDLNAAASHSLLELYSKLKQLNLDQHTPATMPQS